jgi:hypothetical protein
VRHFFGTAALRERQRSRHNMAKVYVGNLDERVEDRDLEAGAHAALLAGDQQRCRAFSSVHVQPASAPVVSGW